MNEQTIEKLLQKAPRVKTPAGLLQQLQAEVELPRANATNHEPRTTNHVFRRWLPALGFALWFLGCVIVFGIQANHMTELKRANEKLASANAAAALLQADQNRERLLTAEIDQLRKDAADVQRLRAEVEALRAQVTQLDALRAQNLQLREELKGQNASAGAPKPEEDFFAIAKERAERVKCIDHLKRVCLAALIWVNENKSDRFPTDTAQFKQHLDAEAGDESGGKLLRCPADHTTPYEFLSLGRSFRDANVVFLRCPIHNNVGTADGAGHQLGNEVQVVQKDGKWIMQNR